MAITVTLNGTAYSVPEPNDTGYGANLTAYLKALATAFPQLGGSVAITSELSFGSSFGLAAPYFRSATVPFASGGALRLARADALMWRNQNNSGDLPLAVDSANNLSFNSNYVTGNPFFSGSTSAGQSIPSGSTETIVTFTVSTDTDGGYSASRYTVPPGKGGHYLVTASIAYSAAQTGICTASIYRNAGVSSTVQAVNPAAQQSIGLSLVMQLLAGDIIDIRTKQPAGTAQTLQPTVALNFLTIKRITT